MATVGQTIYNPVTHERITFLETPRDPDTDRLVFECAVTPGGAELAPHIHANQDERFEIISGKLGAMLDGVTHELNRGDTIVLPAGIKHRWWNRGDDEVRFRVEVTPARNLETILEVLAALAQEGALTKKGMPKNPFHLANIGKVSGTFMPGIPIWMQRFGLTMGSLTGRLLGYSPAFPEYVGRAATAEAALEQAA